MEEVIHNYYKPDKLYELQIPELNGFKINWDDIWCYEESIEIPFNGDCKVSVNKYKGIYNDVYIVFNDVFCPGLIKYNPYSVDGFEADNYFEASIVKDYSLYQCSCCSGITDDIECQIINVDGIIEIKFHELVRNKEISYVDIHRNDRVVRIGIMDVEYSTDSTD